MAGGAVLIAVAAWGAWTLATSKGARPSVSVPQPAAETTHLKAADPSPPKTQAAPDPTNEVRSVLAAAAVSATNGRYAEAMGALGRAHRLLGESNVTGSARAASGKRIDSLTTAIERACSSERAMHLKRGESPPPCPVRSW
jgi:hypothetical protein